MAERTPFRFRLLSGTAYSCLMCLLLLINIVPYDIWPRRFPGPDLMVAITFVWLLHRPAQIPTPLVAVVFFVADILLMRPIGLWAALMVLAAEFMRHRRRSVRERTFVAEWALASGVLLAATLANVAVLSAVLFESVLLDRAMFQAGSTIMAYPLVSMAARHAFGGTSTTATGKAREEAG